jgi:hypothetical protein
MHTCLPIGSLEAGRPIDMFGDSFSAQGTDSCGCHFFRFSRNEVLCSVCIQWPGLEYSGNEHHVDLMCDERSQFNVVLTGSIVSSGEMENSRPFVNRSPELP